jgi:hypothetical protein
VVKSYGCNDAESYLWDDRIFNSGEFMPEPDSTTFYVSYVDVVHLLYYGLLGVDINVLEELYRSIFDDPKVFEVYHRIRFSLKRWIKNSPAERLKIIGSLDFTDEVLVDAYPANNTSDEVCGVVVPKTGVLYSEKDPVFTEDPLTLNLKVSDVSTFEVDAPMEVKTGYSTSLYRRQIMSRYCLMQGNELMIVTYVRWDSDRNELSSYMAYLSDYGDDRYIWVFPSGNKAFTGMVRERERTIVFIEGTWKAKRLGCGKIQRKYDLKYMFYGNVAATIIEIPPHEVLEYVDLIPFNVDHVKRAVALVSVLKRRNAMYHPLGAGRYYGIPVAYPGRCFHYGFRPGEESTGKRPLNRLNITGYMYTCMGMEPQCMDKMDMKIGKHGTAQDDDLYSLHAIKVQMGGRFIGCGKNPAGVFVQVNDGGYNVRSFSSEDYSSVFDLLNHTWLKKDGVDAPKGCKACTTYWGYGIVDTINSYTVFRRFGFEARNAHDRFLKYVRGMATAARFAWKHRYDTNPVRVSFCLTKGGFVVMDSDNRELESVIPGDGCAFSHPLWAIRNFHDIPKPNHDNIEDYASDEDYNEIRAKRDSDVDDV